MTKKPARFRLAYAMVVVVIAALDFALIRRSRFFTGNGTPDYIRLQLIVLSVLPMTNVLAISLFLLAHQSGPTRRFLGGFAASAAFTSVLFLAGATFLDRGLIQLHIESLLRAVAPFVFQRNLLLGSMRIVILSAIYVSIFGLPQLLLAVVVGFIARVFGQGREKPLDLRIRHGTDG
jgi:hypothetical protein